MLSVMQTHLYIYECYEKSVCVYTYNFLRMLRK